MNQLITVDAIDEPQAFKWANALSNQLKAAMPDLPIPLEDLDPDVTEGLPRTIDYLLQARKRMDPHQGASRLVMVSDASLGLTAARAWMTFRTQAEKYPAQTWTDVVLPMANALGKGISHTVAIFLQLEGGDDHEDPNVILASQAAQGIKKDPAVTVIRIPVTPGEEPHESVIRDLAALVQTICHKKEESEAEA